MNEKEASEKETNETVWRPSKGWLGDKKIPKNKDGNPVFETLGCEKNQYDLSSPTSVLAVFTSDQVVYLVNKALYQLEYQRETHRKRAAEEQEVLGPIKKKVRELFGVSYLRATESQVRLAIEAVRKEQLEDLDNQKEHSNG